MKLKAAAVLICFLAVITAATTVPAQAKRPVVITVLMHEASAKNELPLIREFNLTHPNIQVNVVSIGIDSTDAQFENALDYFMLDPSLVDVMLIDIIRPAEYALLDIAAPLDDFLGDDYLAEYLDGPLDACRYQGKLYGLPLFINGGLLFYRKDLLLKERLSPPRTLDELVTQAKRLSRRYGLNGYAFQGAPYEGLVCDYLEYVIGHGGEISIEPGNILVNTPENVAALQFMVDLVHTHQITPPPEEILRYNETLSQALFKSGHAAFLRTWQPFSRFSQEEPTAVKNRVDFDAVPGKTPDVFGSTLGGWVLAISTYSKHPREAWEVIKFLLSTPNQDKRLSDNLEFPSRRFDVMERELGTGDVQVARMQSYLEETVPRPNFPFYRLASYIFQKYLHEALKQKISPADALASIENEIAGFIEKVGPGLSSLASYEALPLNLRKPVLVSAHKDYLTTYLNLVSVLSVHCCDSPAARKALDEFTGAMERYRQTYRILLEKKKEQDRTTLRYAMGPDMTTLDPHDAMDDPTFRIHKNIYDTLVEFTPHMQPVPLLAERWECSNDGLKWTFYLRDDVTFHDGTPLNARAVKANFERLLDPASNLKRRSLFQDIASVEDLDEFTVRFIMNNPFAPLLNYLAHNAGSIVSPSAFSGEVFSPVGTGPFVFKEWIPWKRVVLERNSTYFLGEPAVPRLEFIPVPEADVRANFLKSGRVDIIYPIPSDQIAVFEDSQDTRVLEKASLRTLYLGFNINRPPFDDRNVRRAVAAAIDPREILWSDLRNHGQVAASTVAPMVFGHSEVGAYGFNLEQALEYLSRAGSVEGFSTELIVPRSRFFMAESIAESIRESLQLIDIKVTIRVLDWDDYVAALSQPAEEATHQMYLFGWSPTSGDADNVLRLIFHSTALPPEGPNRMFYRNDKVDALVTEALQTTDPGRRNELYAKVQSTLHRDVPCIPLFVLNQIFAVRKRVSGLEMVPNEIIRLHKAVLSTE